MRRVSTFLCGIAAAVLLAGCGADMPELTQEETDLISEYAVGVLLKYDKRHSSRLVDTEGYDTASAEVSEEDTPEKKPEETSLPEEEVQDDTQIVDVSEDEAVAMPSTVEEYYGIQDVSFRYTGYELQQSYPPETGEEEGNLVFAMDATAGMQLLVLRFTVTNLSTSDQMVDMLAHGARFRISVNGEASKGALATMLLNDMQTFKDVVPAGSEKELVSIIEVPQSISVDSIQFMMRGNGQDAVISLQ